MDKSGLVEYFGDNYNNEKVVAYFSIVKELIQHFRLSNNDLRLVVNVRPERFTMPITINNRYVVNTGFGDTIAFIMPREIDEELSNKWLSVIKYNEFSRRSNESSSPTWWRIPLERVNEFLSECKELWYIAVEHELNASSKSQFKKSHIPELYGLIVGEELSHITIDGSETTRNGAGYGSDFQNNKVIEEKAVNFVKNHYEQLGWNVLSVEQEYVGYDLLCTKESVEEHVEVKGVSGASPSFIITSNELKSSNTDDLWVLHIVYCLATDTPKHKKLTGKEFQNSYTCNPTQFQAKPNS